ncbi:hypothetical protein PAXRUDRAFT_168867, partial [Paxillus rubicundulus Ve08.2h10]
IPTEEVFLSIIVLNALLGELSGVQTQVASLLSSSSKDRPFTSADIHACLDTEQQLLDNEKAWSIDVALAASTTCMKHRNYSHGNEKVCLLCTKHGHTINGCWQPGGGMAGRCDKALARIHAEKTSRENKGSSQLHSGASMPKSTSTSTSVPHSICYDNSGCAYIVDSVTGGAVFLVVCWAGTQLDPQVPPYIT